MAKNEPRAAQKPYINKAAERLGALALIGEKNNYNLQPEVTEYKLWPFSTIEWATTENKFHARVIVQHKTSNDMVVFNSWHQDFNDAERAIALVSDSLRGVGERRVYNIFGEVTEVHTSDIGGGTIVNVIEVLALLWSMQQSVP
jgi:hypothetical protein